MFGTYAIIVRHGPAADGATGDEWRRVCRNYEVRPVVEEAGVSVVATAETPITRSSNGRWTAIGHLFDRLDPVPADRAVEDLSGVDDLLWSRWGGYVALELSQEQNLVRVLRDPSGAQPCWMARGDSADVFSNDVRLGLALTGIANPSLSWEQVAATLLFPDLRGPATPVDSVDEVQPGTERRRSATERRWRTELRWSPWRFAGPTERIDDCDAATSLLRRQADHAVRCWSLRFRRPLVELSGGLDSSLVAAALVAAELPLHAVTLVTPGPDGDERRYAAMVATSLGGTLREVAASADMVDLERSASANLPRPASRAFAQAGDRLNVETARLCDADAFLSGGGGDNVFAYFHSALPAADRLLSAGPGANAWRTLADAAQLTRESIWQTGRQALARAWTRRSLPLWRRDSSLLTADATMAAMPGHPWLTPPIAALPGKHWHIRLLITIQNHLEGFARDGLPMIFPLLAQPLVEHALRIPSWLWIDGGRDRALARRAFAGRLPKAILERRTKGGLDSLADAILSRHGAVLAGMLLDGWLASNGILDRAAVEQALSAPTPAMRLRLLALADVEAWVRCWR